MTLPADTSPLIEKRLDEFLNGSAHELQGAAREHRALPVYTDVGGTLFLKSTGEVLFQEGSSKTAELKPEKSAQWTLIARLIAAERFPELAGLVPTRPESTPDCVDCEGRGRVLNDCLRCDACHGLGWIQQ